MPRTTDDLQDPEPWRPLGERVTPPAPQPREDKQVAPGVFERPDGRLYTDIPLSKGTP